MLVHVPVADEHSRLHVNNRPAPCLQTSMDSGCMGLAHIFQLCHSGLLMKMYMDEVRKPARAWQLVFALITAGDTVN